VLKTDVQKGSSGKEKERTLTKKERKRKRQVVETQGNGAEKDNQENLGKKTFISCARNRRSRNQARKWSRTGGKGGTQKPGAVKEEKGE